MYWLHRTKIWLACLFSWEIPKSFCSKDEKDYRKVFQQKKTITQNVSFGLLKNNLEKNALKFLPKKPKTGVTKYEKIYEEIFVSKTITFLQNVLLDTFWKSGWKKIAVSPRTLAHDLKFFQEFFFPKTFTKILWTNKMQFWRPWWKN